MSDYLGDFPAGSIARYLFATTAAGVPATLAGSPAVSIYKDGVLAESVVGVTLTVDYDGRVGLNMLVIDQSADLAFFSEGSDFAAVITAGTIGGASAVGRTLCAFSIMNRSAGDVSALLAEVAAIKAKTDNLPAAPASTGDVTGAQAAVLAKLPAALVSGRIDASVGAYPGNTVQTGDAFARIGAPAGASVSADVAAVKSDTGGTLTAAVATLVAVDTEVGAIKAKTDQLTFTTPNQVDASSAGGGVTAAAIADAVYDELLSGHTASGSGGEALNRLEGIAAKTALISSGTAITVTTPVTEDGDIDDIVPGDAYDLDHARALPFSFSGAPNLTGATVTLVIASAGVAVISKAATSVVAGAGTQSATFELTAVQTSLLTRIGRPAYSHQVQAVWPADSPIQPAVLIEGVVHTRRRFA